jgi:hypothetical protein
MALLLALDQASARGDQIAFLDVAPMREEWLYDD